MIERLAEPPSDAKLSWNSGRGSDIATLSRARNAETEAGLTWAIPAEEFDEKIVEKSGKHSPAPYKLGHRIASGGMGEIWDAEQLALERRIAIKRIRQDRLMGAQDGLRDVLHAEFRNEALAAASLEHPNIVPIYDLGDDGIGNPLLAMKIVKGRSWDTIIASDQNEMPDADFLAKHLPILISVSQAVAFAHARGIIHRDLKPSQVMVGEFGEVLLMDWGLAIRAGDHEMASHQAPPSIPSPATASSPAGTPAMMAPEQTQEDASSVTSLTDVFLLGGCLYVLLTGTCPHEAKTGEEAFRQARKCKIELPRDRNPYRIIPDDLEELAMKALSYRPEDRLRTAMEFVTQLQDHLSGASKRRHSELLAAECQKLLVEPGNRYESFHRALSLLEQSRREWPDNPVLDGLSLQALAGQAGLALKNGDLALARVQAESMPVGDRRIEILDRVTLAEAKREKVRFLFRAAVTAVVLLCVAIGAGGAWTANTLEKKNAMAMAQYKGAGELVGFMLDDLRRTLDMQVEHDQQVAQAVAEGTVKYLRNIDYRKLDRELQEEHAQQLLRFAVRFADLQRFLEGQEILDELQPLFKQLYAPQSVEMARFRALQGGVALHLRDLPASEENLKFAISIFRTNPAIPVSELAHTLGVFGLMKETKGELDQAHDALIESIELKKTHDPDSLAETQLMLSQVLLEMENVPEASAIIEAARLQVEATDGPQSLLMADVLEKTANLYRQERRPPAETMQVLQQALAIRMPTMGPDHPLTNGLMNNIAHLKGVMGHYDEAIADFKAIIESRKRTVGDRHPEIATTLNNIGNNYINSGRHDEGLPYLLEAIQIQEEAMGPNDPHLGLLLSNLGATYGELGRYEEAVPFFERALSIREAAFGREHGQALNSRFGYFEMLVAWALREDAAGTAGSSTHWREARDLAAGFEEKVIANIPILAIQLAIVMQRVGETEEATKIAEAFVLHPITQVVDNPQVVAFRALCAELDVAIPEGPKEEATESITGEGEK